jgi:hypothetical protein
MGEMIRDHAGDNGAIESDDAMIARYAAGLAAEGRG